MSYQIRERVGRGGMGVVGLAVDPAGRPVALKRITLHGSAYDMERARRRVRREAEALTRVDHPSIVRLLAVLDEPDEIVLVMPYLSGGTLSDHVRARGPLASAQVETLASTLLGALAAAHREGVVHRDIKPANVLFDEQGNAYLADFGVASFRDATSGLTATGSLIGTPDFMAPEQARGEPAGPASDVFALGATLLYAATGQTPYGGTDPRVVVQRAARGRLAPLPPTLDPTLRARLVPLLRRDPHRRPSAAAAAGGPQGTRVLSRPGRRATTAVAVTLAAVLAIVAGAAAWAYARDHRVRFGAEDSAADVTSTTAPCTAKTYQPCGQPAAPNTDGSRCVADHADYDGDVTNGCEAAPDQVDGQPLTDRIRANLVPADDVDTYPTTVGDRFDLLCDGTFEVSLTAPAGSAMRLEVLRGTEVLGTAVSRDGRTESVTLSEQSCLGDDSAALTSRVSWEGTARSADSYVLRRRGSF